MTRVHLTLLQRVFQIAAGASLLALFALCYEHVALGQEDVSECICPSTRYAKTITGSKYWTESQQHPNPSQIPWTEGSQRKVTRMEPDGHIMIGESKEVRLSMAINRAEDHAAVIRMVHEQLYLIIISFGGDRKGERVRKTKGCEKNWRSLYV